MSLNDREITSPEHPRLGELCQRLAGLADQLDLSDRWPAEQLRLCADYGVFKWFLPQAWDGFGWTEPEIIRGYLQLSTACLTTTFVITQRTGACSRILASDNESLKAQLLPDLAWGRTLATVGISHLTTSRRHVAKPVLAAQPSPDGSYLLEGYSPWVTGAQHADTIVAGATLPDGRQFLAALPTNLPGTELVPPLPLVGLSASHTGEVRYHKVRAAANLVIAGPIENVMQSGTGAGTGGLNTSALALGLSRSAIDFLTQQSTNRENLRPAAEQLQAEYDQAASDLLALAGGLEPGCSGEAIRARANSLVLRATQATLAAAKGTGYVKGHPAGRWCREALFFLVWSCPQPVLHANLCELAGLGFDE